MNFLQKPVGVKDDGKSVFDHFKKSALFNEIESYEVVKCNRGWWKIATLTIGGYEHHTDALYHFEYGKCDLVVANPTLSFLHSLDLHKDTQYTRDFDRPFDSAVFLEQPIDAHDLINYLEKRYSETNLTYERRDDKIRVIARDDSPSREWNECPYWTLCLARVEKNETIKVMLLYPSPEMMEYHGF